VAIQIQFKRGSFSNMPSLADGEFYLATDKLQLYVGFGGLRLAVGGPMSAVSLSDNVGKTNMFKTGQLTSTAVTANQVIATDTVTAGKTLFLQLVDIQARLTVPAATASVLGTVSLRVGGTAVYTAEFVNPTTSDVRPISLVMSEPIPIAAGVVVDVVVTPAAVTSMRWTANLIGFEK
jgi:hypothetical protein